MSTVTLEERVAKLEGLVEELRDRRTPAETPALRRNPALTDAELMEYCRQQFTGYKRPKYLEFRADLPKTNVGKILRRELRDEKKAA